MKAYSKEVELYIVQQFVVSNKRAPTEEELVEAKKAFNYKNPNVSRRGIFNASMQVPGFRKESSSEEENSNRRAIFADVVALTRRLNGVEKSINTMTKHINSGMNRASLAMNRILLQAEALSSLLNSKSSPIISISESFDRAVKIQSGDLDVAAGRVMLQKTSDDKVLLESSEFRVFSESGPGFIGSYQINNVADMYKDNGKYWQRIGMSNTESTYTMLGLEWKFSSEEYVSEVKWNGMAGVSGRWTVMYSTDGISWSVAGSAGHKLRETNVATVGLTLLGIRIILEKDKADVEMNNGAWGHIYAFDKLEVNSSYYSTSGSAVLGPYPVKDMFGDSYAFGSVSLSACAIDGDDTQISMFVSKDGTNWTSVDHEGGDDDFVVLDNTASITFALHDSLYGVSAVISEAYGIDSFSFQNEGLINMYADGISVKPNLVVLKRNIKNTANPSKEVNGAPAGWRYSEGEWHSTIYTANDRKLDVGPNSVKVNGSNLSGVIFIPAGIHKISVQDANWHELEFTSVSKESTLIDSDPLYPYNHRYLFDGLSFSSDYNAPRVYQGMDEVYESRMMYLPMEAFVQMEDDNPLYYDYFSILFEDGNSYFVVKVNKSHGTWNEEEYSLSWTQPSGNTNLFVKVDMETVDDSMSPVLIDFVAKVV